MICFRRFLWKVKKIREVIREEKVEKTKARKVNVELFIAE